MNKRHKYLIIGTLFISAAFYFLYFGLSGILSGDITHPFSLTFGFIAFYHGGKFLYRGWKMDKLAMAIKTDQTILPKKIRIMVSVGGSVLAVGALVTGHRQSTLITGIGGLIFAVGATMFIIGVTLYAQYRIRKPTT